MDIHNSSSQHQAPVKCPSVGEKMSRLWYIHTMEYYQAIKRKASSICTAAWINLIFADLSIHCPIT
jgi:hypothetical protein